MEHTGLGQGFRVETWGHASARTQPLSPQLQPELPHLPAANGQGQPRGARQGCGRDAAAAPWHGEEPQHPPHRAEPPGPGFPCSGLLREGDSGRAGPCSANGHRERDPLPRQRCVPGAGGSWCLPRCGGHGGDTGGDARGNPRGCDGGDPREDDRGYPSDDRRDTGADG